MTNNKEETRIKKTRNPHPWSSDEKALTLEPGDNARYLRAARAPLKLPPIDISDPQQVQDRIDQYFEYCEDNDLKPGVAMLANWLGVDRTTLFRWGTGESRTDAHRNPVKKATALIESLWESYMTEGKMNVVAGIFLAKNNYGYTDKQEISVKAQAESPALTAEEIAEALPDADEKTTD